MTSSHLADLGALKSNDLVFIPLPENDILLYAEPIFAEWQKNLQSGVVLLEFSDREETEESSKKRKFSNCWSVQFEEAWSLQNSAMSGRYLVWLNHPDAFFVTDFGDFSGLVCNPDILSRVFQRSLQDLLNMFEHYVNTVKGEHERKFFSAVFDHYSLQTT